MTQKPARIDRFFLMTTAVLTAVGFVIFLSASLGLLAENGAQFQSVAMKQTVSLAIGVAAFFIFARIRYTFARKRAFLIFIGAIILNVLLFIPSISFYHGGATRWINLGFFTFQPSEFLKIAFILYLAAWINFARDRLKDWRFGLLPYAIIMAVLSALLLSQPDTDTLVIIGFTGLVMLVIAGMPLRHVAIAGILMAVVLGAVIMFRPYVYQRVQTFFNRSTDDQGAGYQVNQSLIAIGSGHWTGRGFGQSIQKFGYLPEPIGDSVFAVAAEEFGLLGAVFLLLLYVLFAAASFRIGTRAADPFGGLTAIGIAILIVTESFVNMAAMLGLIPLSGIPLLFVSHGGTALIITLSAAGIVANISRYRRHQE